MAMQTTYDFVFGGGAIALVSVDRRVMPITTAMVGRWRKYALPWWTMVWSGAQGYDGRVGKTQKEIAYPARSWAIHAPNSEFWERARAVEDEREVMWLCISLDGALEPLTSRRFTLVLDRDQRIADPVRRMHGGKSRGSVAGDMLAQAMLLTVLGEVLSAAHCGGSGDDSDPWRLDDPDEGKTKNGLLATIDLLVSRSLSSPPSRSALARHLGMSESSLSHRFRAETGMTLVERLRWLRINEAKIRLREGKSVKSVAASLGFGNAFYFSRVFKEIVGIAPAEFTRDAARR
jgi:AraC-like DNA-binding protein